MHQKIFVMDKDYIVDKKILGVDVVKNIQIEQYIIGLYGRHTGNGKMEGTPSLRNKKYYELRYDPEKEDFVVGRMVPNPRFR